MIIFIAYHLNYHQNYFIKNLLVFKTNKSFYVNIIVTCSYIPPNSDLETYLSHLKKIEIILSTIRHRDSVIMFGDFNMPSIKWLQSSDYEYLFPSYSEN